MDSDLNRLTWLILIRRQTDPDNMEDGLANPLAWHPFLRDVGHEYPNLLEKVGIAENIESSKN